MKPTSSFLTVATAVAMAITPASAATVLVEKYENLGVSNAGSASFSFDTVTASNSVLFVAIGSELNTINSVTFNGVTVSTPITSGNTTRESWIYAFDLGNETATTGQSISIDATKESNSGYGAMALQVSNADFSFIGGMTKTNNTDITIPALGTGSLVLDVMASNPATLVSSGLTRTTVLSELVAASMDTQSSLISNTTGGGDIGWTGQSTASSHSAVWISPVPEPSAALLGGFGCLLLLRRRRR